MECVSDDHDHLDGGVKDVDIVGLDDDESSNYYLEDKIDFDYDDAEGIDESNDKDDSDSSGLDDKVENVNLGSDREG